MHAGPSQLSWRCLRLLLLERAALNSISAQNKGPVREKEWTWKRLISVPVRHSGAKVQGSYLCVTLQLCRCCCFPEKARFSLAGREAQSKFTLLPCWIVCPNSHDDTSIWLAHFFLLLRMTRFPSPSCYPCPKPTACLKVPYYIILHCPRVPSCLGNHRSRWATFFCAKNHPKWLGCCSLASLFLANFAWNMQNHSFSSIGSSYVYIFLAFIRIPRVSLKFTLNFNHLFAASV